MGTVMGQICCICECALFESVHAFVSMCACVPGKPGGLMAINTNDILMLSVPAHHSHPHLFVLSAGVYRCVYAVKRHISSLCIASPSITMAAHF